MIRRIGALTGEQLEGCKSHIPSFQKASDQVQAAISEMEACKQKFSYHLKVGEITHGLSRSLQHPRR